MNTHVGAIWTKSQLGRPNDAGTQFSSLRTPNITFDKFVRQSRQLDMARHTIS